MHTPLVKHIHNSGQRLVIAVTGGGSRFISDLLTVPGASKSVLEARVPYSAAANAEWMGGEPASYCSRETAIRMASAGWWRARQLLVRAGEVPQNCVGVACTASLASDRPKRGDHRCWIALQSDRESVVASVTLEKDRRTRDGEESVVADLLLYLTAEACGVADRHVPLLTGDETVVVDVAASPEAICMVRSGQVPFVWSLPDAAAGTGDASDSIRLTEVPGEAPAGLLCGSFNPLHRGHLAMRSVAECVLKGPVGFELAVVNAEKPPLDFFEIERRRRQFQKWPLVLTAAPRFVDKARLFPGVAFVIGFDTAERVLQPRFYEGPQESVEAALSEIAENGCRFLVAGRATDGGFQTLDDLEIPESVCGLFEAIPEAKFRDDISSTQLRRTAGDV